jgi:hypothetical protein
VSAPAPQQAVLRQAEHLGRRHGKAAVYWQLGDSGSDAALAFYRSLLRGAAGDPQITGLFEMPGLDGRQDYDRDSLAAAREEFWREAARLARRRLQASGSRTAGEDGNQRQDITDPATGLSRLLAERCSTCILRPGDKMHLGAEHTARFVRQALDAGSYVVCHQTLTYGDNPDFGPAICRGFFDAYADRSPALRLLQAFSRLTEVEPPQPETGAP